MEIYQRSYEESIINEPVLNKRVYNIIRNRIIFDELHPGQQLSVASLSKELQVSRTPVSVALSALERDGYVVVQPKRGTFVRELTPYELEIIFKARASMGKLIIESAGYLISKEQLHKFQKEFRSFRSMKYITNPYLIELFYLDVEFHRLLDECIPGIIHDQFKVIADLTMNSRYIAYRNRFGGLSDQQIKILCCDTHLAIIDALLKNDGTKASDYFVQDVYHGLDAIRPKEHFKLFSSPKS
ncbi:MAG: GntR family transcriptional regulator [Lachnospiraceae bacterium]|nr:GntR family transcriptional regulator [Lachnospiraceae bacterium]